jgi:SAM-dependent methyltransferase
MIDLLRISEQLILTPDGIWTTPNHKDLAFLAEDVTDWIQAEENSFWYHHRNRCFIEILKHFSPKGTLFEVGAGNGSVSLSLQKQGLSIVAIEPTVKMAYQAKRRGVNHVICATLESAKIKEGSLANVGMFDILEHIPNDESFLRQVRRLMPPAGRFYCSVPSYPFLWSCEDEAAGHLRRYRLTSLCKKINRSGFEIEYASYFFAPLILPILMVRALPSWFGLRGKRTHQSTMREHQLRPGLVCTLLERALEWELSSLSRGKRHRFGTSCIVVARAV